VPRATWGEGKVVDFQLWIRQLLSDATSRNKAHVVADLDPHALRTLYDQGTPPSIEGLIAKTSAERSSS